MRTRKCGALEAQAWLAHEPSTGEFKYNPKADNYVQQDPS